MVIFFALGRTWSITGDHTWWLAIIWNSPLFSFVQDSCHGSSHQSFKFVAQLAQLFQNGSQLSSSRLSSAKLSSVQLSFFRMSAQLSSAFSEGHSAQISSAQLGSAKLSSLQLSFFWTSLSSAQLSKIFPQLSSLSSASFFPSSAKIFFFSKFATLPPLFRKMYIRVSETPFANYFLKRIDKWYFGELSRQFCALFGHLLMLFSF